MFVVLLACGSQSSSTTTTAPSSEPREAERATQERAAIVAKHRKLESAQQDALAATCSDMTAWAAQHCSPSCYALETSDRRAGTKLAGPVVVEHHLCQRVVGAARAPSGSWLVMDELAPRRLDAKPFRGRSPRAHKAGTWQAEVAAAFAAIRAIGGKAPRGEVVSVVGGAARAMTHPVTRDSLRCVIVAHHANVARGARAVVDACGLTGRATCEAAGNAAARGLNLARFRLAEAARLRGAGKDDACRAAALDALATARGLPRWRQFAKLNVGEWTEGLAYRTRYDGVLDEDELFALAPAIVTAASELHAACGGSPSPATTPEHEHAFHSCK